MEPYHATSIPLQFLQAKELTLQECSGFPAKLFGGLVAN